MSTIRNPIKRKYTIVPTNLILDDGLSSRSKQLYIYLSSMADNVHFYYNEVMEALDYNNRTTLWADFKDLLNNGWISRRKIQDIKGLFKNGYEFVLHETKIDETKTDYGYKEFLESIEEPDTLRLITIEIPEDLNIQSEPASVPVSESIGWFLIKNTQRENNYDIERLFTNKQLLTKNYFLKRKRMGTKYIDFMHLGKDIKHVNLSESDFFKLLKKYGEEKLKRMILTLDEWLSRPENERYLNAVRTKSCIGYFRSRNWVEEKVRQQLIKERRNNDRK